MNGSPPDTKAHGTLPWVANHFNNNPRRGSKAHGTLPWVANRSNNHPRRGPKPTEPFRGYRLRRGRKGFLHKGTFPRQKGPPSSMTQETTAP